MAALIPVALAGCEGAASNTAATPAATVAPTTTTTLDPAVMYRQQYLNIVAAGNCRQDQTRQAFDAVMGSDKLYTQADWPRLKATVQPAFIAYADAQILSFQSAAQLQWPPAAQAAIQDLIKDFTADAAAARDIGEASTFDGFASAVDAYSAMDAASNSAATVRAILGLPTNLVDDGYDWCKGPPNAATLTQAIPTTTSTPATTTP